MNFDRNSKSLALVSLVFAVVGLSFRVVYPNFQGEVVSARAVISLLLVTMIAVTYVYRNGSSANVYDGFAVAGIAIIVAVPVFTLFEAVSGAVLWNLPVMNRISVGVVLFIVIFNTILLTVVPLAAMFVLGTASSRREYVSVIGGVALVSCLSLVPLIARSAFEFSSIVSVAVSITTAMLLGAPLFVLARFVESGELQGLGTLEKH